MSPASQAVDVAERMGINQNYVAECCPGLQGDGKLEKRGRGL